MDRPEFTVQIFKADEGTREPFMARMWAGAMELRDHLPQHLRQPFEDLYPLNSLEAARERAKALSLLLASHRAKLTSGEGVSRQPSVLYLPESIDLPLNREFSAFVLDVARAFKTTQDLTRRLGVEIGCVYVSAVKFEAGLAALGERGESELATYLAAARRAWGDRLTQRRIAVEHGHWSLPPVRYREIGEGRAEMAEPAVDGQAVSAFVAEMLGRVVAFVEDMVALSVQRHIRPPCTLGEIPRGERDPQFPRRFELIAPALQPSKRPWRLTPPSDPFPDN